MENETPQALCPPLASVEQAIAARVGEVTGANFRVSYQVVRDTASGQNLVRLRMFSEEDQQVLLRDIPLRGADCSDISQALALILESYFATLPNTNAPRAESEPETGNEKLPQEDPSEPAPLAPNAEPQAPPSSEEAPYPSGTTRNAWAQWWLRFGVGGNSAPSTQLEAFAGTRFEHGSIYAGVSLEPAKTELDSIGHALSAWSHTGVAGAQLEYAFTKRWRSFVGSEIGAEYQLVRVGGDGVSPALRHHRWIPTWGVPLGVSMALSPRLAIGLLGRATLRTDAKEFVIVGPAIPKYEVDPLPAFRLQGTVFVEFMLD